MPLTIAPTPYKLKATSKRLAAFDTETDPFEHGLSVLPFTCGFGTYNPEPEDIALFTQCTANGYHYIDFWGDDCIAQFFEWALGLEGEYLVYVHNGGNFDFYFMLEYMDRGSAPFIINGRLARIYLQGIEFRDSYSLIPVALAEYEKTKVQYDWFKRDLFYLIDTREPVRIRDAYRDIIQPYQRDDCLFLCDLVQEAHSMFGNRLTMASIALPMLMSYHGVESMRESTDTEMRPYYFGGRCQPFEVGELKGDWKIYDVNSMYPHVMATALHPVSSRPHYEDTITDRTDFAYIDAWSNGALPVRQPDGALSFPVGNGRFYASIHEIQAGLETGTLRINRVFQTIYFEAKTTFKEFVETFYSLRLDADAKGDKIHKLYYKLVPNSSYGKLAQDPRKYENYLFNPASIPKPLKCDICEPETDNVNLCPFCIEGISSPYGWYLHTMRGDALIYARPASSISRHGFYNVATASSITGAARAFLLRGIMAATRPIYCDTDSIICEALDAELDNRRLGAWKLEATGDTACIAGKKLYAIFDADKPIKSASKGVKLTPNEIARVCAGEVVEYKHPVPKFSLTGDVSFTRRSIVRTGAFT